MKRGIALAVVLAVAAVGAIAVALVRSASSGCSFPSPVNANLPPALRSLGGYDQAFDAADTTGLQTASVTAATALHPDLIGVSASGAVREQAAASGPSALVIPLQRRGPAGAQVVALAAFLTDCTGRPFFDAVEDLSGRPLATYPVARPQSTDNVQLEFRGDPFHPFWG